MQLLKHWYQVFGMLKQHPGCSYPPCAHSKAPAWQQWDHSGVWFVREGKAEPRQELNLWVICEANRFMK